MISVERAFGKDFYTKIVMRHAYLDQLHDGDVPTKKSGKSTPVVIPELEGKISMYFGYLYIHFQP